MRDRPKGIARREVNRGLRLPCPRDERCEEFTPKCFPLAFPQLPYSLKLFPQAFPTQPQPSLVRSTKELGPRQAKRFREELSKPPNERLGTSAEEIEML